MFTIQQFFLSRQVGSNCIEGGEKSILWMLCLRSYWFLSMTHRVTVTLHITNSVYYVLINRQHRAWACTIGLANTLYFCGIMCDDERTFKKGNEWLCFVNSLWCCCHIWKWLKNSLLYVYIPEECRMTLNEMKINCESHILESKWR